MKRKACGVVLGMSVFASLGCNQDSNPVVSALEPFRDDWQVVFEGPFASVGDDGSVRVSTLTIGGREFMGNFANRGDVIARFADVDTIKVEMRRFTMSSSQEQATADFEALEPWAYTVSPRAPGDLEDEDNCMAYDAAGNPLPWQDDCTILVYYRGLNQLARAGADLRVTLPETYRYRLNIRTEDNDQETDYLNRGNVCVENLNASAQIEVGSGSVYVALADEVTAMPVCPAADIAVCEKQQWAMGCPCDTLGQFGSVKIDSGDAAAADMYVDIPSGLWAAPNLENEANGQLLNPPGDGQGARCDATVCFSPDQYELDEDVVGLEVNRDPWRNKGFINLPGPDATKSGGFRLALTSDDCASVSFTEDPESYVGEGRAQDQSIEERGNMQVCSGCLRTQTCEQLLEMLPSWNTCS